MRAALNEAGIPSAVYYPVPLNRQPALYSDVPIPKSEYAADHVLSIPMHPYLSESDQDQVIEALKKAITN